MRLSNLAHVCAELRYVIGIKYEDGFTCEATKRIRRLYILVTCVVVYVEDRKEK